MFIQYFIYLKTWSQQKSIVLEHQPWYRTVFLRKWIACPTQNVNNFTAYRRDRHPLVSQHQTSRHSFSGRLSDHHKNTGAQVKVRIWKPIVVIPFPTLHNSRSMGMPLPSVLGNVHKITLSKKINFDPPRYSFNINGIWPSALLTDDPHTPYWYRYLCTVPYQNRKPQVFPTIIKTREHRSL